MEKQTLENESSHSGPMNRYAPEIATSLVAGALGLAIAGPAGGAVGAIAGAVGSALVDAFSKHPKPPSP